MLLVQGPRFEDYHVREFSESSRPPPLPPQVDTKLLMGVYEFLNSGKLVRALVSGMVLEEIREEIFNE